MIEELKELINRHDRTVGYVAYEDKVEYFIADGSYKDLEDSIHAQFACDDYVYNYGIIHSLEDLPAEGVYAEMSITHLKGQ